MGSTAQARFADQATHDYLYFASDEGETSVGVRYRDWKLVRYREAPSEWRLYDLATDIGEADDVAADHPDVVQTILDLLERDGLS